MEPNNSTTGNNLPTTDPNFQQPIYSGPKSAHRNPVASINKDPQQPPAASQSYDTNGQIKQSPTEAPRYVKLMTKICLVLGIITIVGTIFIVLRLASIEGLSLSYKGAAITSSSLMKAVCILVSLCGTILCVATLIAIFVAKNRYHISVKKPVLVTVCSMLMIYALAILINVLNANAYLGGCYERCTGLFVRWTEDCGLQDY